MICFEEAYPPVSGLVAVSFNTVKFLSGERLLIQATHGRMVFRAWGCSHWQEVQKGELEQSRYFVAGSGKWWTR
jgi:hypothetical protein